MERTNNFIGMVCTNKLNPHRSGYTEKLHTVESLQTDVCRMIENEIEVNGDVSIETAAIYDFLVCHMPVLNPTIDEVVAETRAMLARRDA